MNTTNTPTTPSALFQPVVDVDVNGTISVDWGSSFVNWTDAEGVLHEDDSDPDRIADKLDARLAAIRAALAPRLRGGNDPLALLVAPFFAEAAQS